MGDPSHFPPGEVNLEVPSTVSRRPSSTLHVLGVAHTVPHEDYLLCAFTGKVLAFPDLIQPYGWRVVEYSNEGSASRAAEHVTILSRERFRALSKRISREDPMDADVHNEPLQREYQRKLVEELSARARPGDIVCHIFGPNMEVCEATPKCYHLELNVGYTASPGLPFRVYETSAWMHWHLGKAGREDGHNYNWVIPSGFDADAWPFCENPDNYAVFMGRVTARKGIDTLVEIAKRMPDLPIHVYGPGDYSPWVERQPENLYFKGPMLGAERVEVVRRARCMLMPTVYIEPFGNAGVEAQLCGVPLLGTSFGAFQETIVDGVTGYRCHTLADWLSAVRLSATLDRKQISELTRRKYSREAVGRNYNWALQQLADLSQKGWYGEVSRKFARD
ncbi:glycosyltransferase [Methylobacterium oxalidis]|uniref:glycosyltransferase n=1 Tax=Methylobacterium oxalidis TaxID=944322 RepID=UPI003314CE03